MEPEEAMMPDGDIGGSGGDEIAPDDEAGQSMPRASKRASAQQIRWAQRSDLHSCIVKLTVQSVNPDYAEPWRTRAQTSRAGTGFLIEGQRIVTNAHVVHRSSHIRARKSSSPVMYSCTVEWICVPLDLAVLSVNEEGRQAFFESGNAKSNSKAYLELRPILPRLDENVTCVGFPTGGAQISVTRGVVSRVDVSGTGTLRIQIDAAINPGNSGGPVFDESGRVVGIASSHLRGGSNIGYIIPVEVLSQFLRMTEDGIEASPFERSVLNAGLPDGTPPESLAGFEGPKTVPGIVASCIYMQTLESKVLRRRLGLAEEHDVQGCGVRVAGIWLPSTEREDEATGDTKTNEHTERLPVHVDDVLMSIDGIDVGQDGTVSLSDDRPDERISMFYLHTKHNPGHEVELGILRKGQPMTVHQTLEPRRYLCPMYDSFDAHASYVVCGGCVFVPLSWPYMQSNKRSSFPSFREIASHPANADEQIIILSKVLADDLNVGFHQKKWLVLDSVNGEKPANIRQLVKLVVEGGGKPYLEFRLHPVSQEDFNQQLITLDMDECKKAESRILKQHMIAQWCSEDAIPIELRGPEAHTMVSLLDKIHSQHVIE